MGIWIVVVDDDPLALTHTKRILREQDMRVSCLRSGRDLLKFSWIYRCRKWMGLQPSRNYGIWKRRRDGNPHPSSS